MDIKLNAFDRGYSAVVVYKNGDITVSLGATNTGVNDNPENVGIVEIDSIDLRIIGGGKFANQLNGVKKVNKDGLNYEYSRIAFHALFTDFLTDPVWGVVIIKDMLKKAKIDGYEAGKEEIKSNIRDLIGIDY